MEPQPVPVRQMNKTRPSIPCSGTNITKISRKQPETEPGAMTKRFAQRTQPQLLMAQLRLKEEQRLEFQTQAQRWRERCHAVESQNKTLEEENSKLRSRLLKNIGKLSDAVSLQIRQLTNASTLNTNEILACMKRLSEGNSQVLHSVQSVEKELSAEIERNDDSAQQLMVLKQMSKAKEVETSTMQRQLGHLQRELAKRNQQFQDQADVLREIRHTLSTMDKPVDRMDEIAEFLQSLHTELRHVKQQQISFQMIFDKNREARSNSESETHKEITDELERLHKRLEQKTTEMHELSDSNNKWKQQATSNKKQLDQMRIAQIQELQTEVADLKQTERKLRRQLEGLENVVQAREDSAKKAREASSNLQRQLAAKQHDLDKAQKELSGFRKVFSENSSQTRSLQSEIIRLRDEMHRNGKDCAKMLRGRDENDKVNEGLLQRLQTVELEKSQLVSELQRCEKLIRQHEETISQVRKEQALMQAELNMWHDLDSSDTFVVVSNEQQLV